jgi:hypothetical protein
MEVALFAAFAFVLFASIALGAATAWLIVWKSKKPILWALAVPFALMWLVLVAGPLIGLGLYLPYRAAMRVPAPVAPAPPVPVAAPTPVSPEPLPQNDSRSKPPETPTQ